MKDNEEKDFKNIRLVKATKCNKKIEEFQYKFADIVNDFEGFLEMLNLMISEELVFFKAKVKDGTATEHMWFKVVSLDYANNSFEGILDNRPVIVFNKYTQDQKYKLSFDIVSNAIIAGKNLFPL